MLKTGVQFLQKHIKLFLSLSFICSISIAEEQKRIVIIDSGVESRYDTKYFCSPNLNKDLTDTTMEDRINHGSIVNAIISQNLPSNYCIINVKFGSHRLMYDSTDQALEYVTRIKGVKYVNISWGGDLPRSQEKLLLNILLKKGIKIFVAAGNNHKNLIQTDCTYYPPCYQFDLKELFIVGSYTGSYSNWGNLINTWEDGKVYYNGGIYTGTFFSAPRALRKNIDENR